MVNASVHPCAMYLSISARQFRVLGCTTHVLHQTPSKCYKAFLPASSASNPTPILPDRAHVRRTSSLSLRKPDSSKRRTSSRPSSSSFTTNPIFNPNHHADNADPQPPVAAVPVTGKSASESAAVDSEHLPTPPSGPSTSTTTAAAAATNNGVVVGGDAAGSATAGPQPGLLLSWEDIWCSVPRTGGRCPFHRRRRGPGHDPDGHLSTDRLAVLTGVSGFAGFAGPSAGASEAAERRKGCGSMTAIMGPSGAGKTTLLNVLAGRHRGGGGAVAGTVRLNGRAVGAVEVRAVSGYLTQEDVLPENLTCFEHLMFHAHLRMWTAGGGGGGGGRRRVATKDRKNRVLEVGRLSSQETSLSSSWFLGKD